MGYVNNVNVLIGLGPDMEKKAVLGDKWKERTQITRGHFVGVLLPLTDVVSSVWTSLSPHLLSTGEKYSFVIESLSSGIMQT